MAAFHMLIVLTNIMFSSCYTIGSSVGDMTKCSKFHFEEKVLEKLVRLEHKIELLEEKLKLDVQKFEESDIKGASNTETLQKNVKAELKSQMRLLGEKMEFEIQKFEESDRKRTTNTIASQKNMEAELESQRRMFEDVVLNFTVQAENISRELKIQQEDAFTDIPGETYVRWGRTKCPKDSSLVYKGYAGGNHYNQGGSGSNFLCLPEKPEWKEFTAGRNGIGVGRIYGVEYEIIYNKPYSKSFLDKDMPCAVCMTSRRPTVLMIPAKISCPKGWHKEYSGYLMSQMDYSGRTPSQYICVDGNLESVPGGDKNRNQAVVYPVEAACGNLKCDSCSYVEGRELTCVVCSK